MKFKGKTPMAGMSSSQGRVAHMMRRPRYRRKGRSAQTGSSLRRFAVNAARAKTPAHLLRAKAAIGPLQGRGRAADGDRHLDGFGIKTLFADGFAQRGRRIDTGGLVGRDRRGR